MLTDTRIEYIPSLDSAISRALRDSSYGERHAMIDGLRSPNFDEKYARLQAMAQFTEAAHSACMYAIAHHL